jgi:hypothetical protein
MSAAVAGGKTNWSLGLSFLAILVSCCGLYYGQLRGARLVTSTGSYVYVQGRPRIGIPVTFFNDGARAGVINSGSMILSDGSNNFLFDLKLVAASSEKWTEDGAKIKPISAPLTLFSPIAIKAGDSAEGVFWYFPRLPDFKFRPETDYSAELTFSRKMPQEGEAVSYGPLTTVDLSTARVVFHIDSLTADNAAKYPDTAIPVPTGWSANP